MSYQSIDKSNQLSKIHNRVNYYWPIEQSEEIKKSFDEMGPIQRIVKLLGISDKQLFVLSGDIDTYVYLLFLRNLIYFVTILAVLNCAVLLPLYATGQTADLCFNNPGNVNATIYLSDIQKLCIGNGINQNSRIYTSFGISLLNTFLCFGFAVRMKGKIDFVARTTKAEGDDFDA